MNEPLLTTLSGSDFVACVDGAFAPVALRRRTTRRHVVIDPTGLRFWDVVVWQIDAMVFAFTRNSASGVVTLEIGDGGLFVDEEEIVASVEVEDAVSGWAFLAAGGLSVGDRVFEHVVRDAVEFVTEHFERLFVGDGSVLAEHRASLGAEAMEELALAEATERDALVDEAWVGGMRVRQLRATAAVIALLDDALPEPLGTHVWTVALPIGFIVCATRDQAHALATSWHGKSDG